MHRAPTAPPEHHSAARLPRTNPESGGSKSERPRQRQRPRVDFLPQCHTVCAVPCRASRVQARPRTGIHRAGRNCRRHVDKDRCTCIRAGPKHCCNVAGLPSMGSRGFAEEKIYYLPSNNSCFYNLSSRDRITNLERFMYISLYISS